jgi:putative flippase GtrA
MNIFKKRDLLLALVIGEACAWLMIFIAGNLAKESQLAAAAFPSLKYLPVVFPILCAFGLLAAYVLSKAIPVAYQFAKFILVGGLNFLIDMAVLNFFVFYTGLAAGLAQSGFKAVSFSAAVVNSYFWNKFWTFRRESSKNAGKEFLQFIVVSVVGFGVNLAVNYAAVNMVAPFAGIQEKTWAQVGALVAAVAALFWNFIGYKFIVFEEKNKFNEQVGAISQIQA